MAGAARIVLRDWSIGKFPRFTPTPATADGSALLKLPASLRELYQKDEEIIAALKPRKEMRKSTGLVKLVAGSIDGRKVDVEAEWTGLDRDGDNNGEGNDEENASEEAESDDEDVEMDNSAQDDEDEESDGEEDEEPTPVLSGKRKRTEKLTASVVRPTKKVSFAADPKGSKRARVLAGSAKKATPVAKNVKSVTPRAKPSKPANISSGKKSPSSGKGAEEAYDFGKFF